jgi:hypothetical protein
MQRFFASQSSLSLGTITALLLTACGGDSGGASSPPPPPPPAAHFSVTAPASANAGAAFNFTVTALDASNTTVSTYSGTVHFTSTDGHAGLPANSKLTNGTGSFPVTLKTPGSQTIAATDSATASITGTSNSIMVSGASATHFSVTAPAAATVGRAIGLTVTALDASNNPVTAYSGTVHFTSTDGQAGLPANSILSNGTQTFPVTLQTAGSETVTATDAATASITGTSNSIQVSPASTSGFRATGSMLTPRESHTATRLLDGTVLMAGGLDIEGREWDFPIASAELFDATSGTFTATGSMATARSGHNATLLANAALASTASYGKVLVTGGGGQTAELYNPASRLFTETGPLHVIRNGETATLLNTGEVLVAGGGSATAELYNPTSGRFTATTGSMAAARTAHTATLLQDGRVLIAGGGLATAELYDPTSGLFTATAGSMAKVRSVATATLLQDGTVLIAGPDATGERFDPTTGYFAPVGPLVPRARPATANLLGNGTVLFTGGFTGGRGAGYVLPSNLAQLYFPTSQSFAGTGSLNTARDKHSGTLLADGRVLIAGGEGDCVPPSPPVSTGICYSLSSAELYQ